LVAVELALKYVLSLHVQGIWGLLTVPVLVPGRGMREGLVKLKKADAIGHPF
jgi:hypothetical protein